MMRLCVLCRSGNLSQLPARFQEATKRGHEAAANGRAAASSASTSTQHLEHTPQQSTASRWEIALWPAGSVDGIAQPPRMPRELSRTKTLRRSEDEGCNAS